ncbi:hypothetical protein LEP1GSC050_4265 [Leptospira broomii serovar Hurstbridge str. 5399]|uniref:Uncharacterized protein n=1 Tax=Leptospira broomii serovar Hurstbridge str. 5399 TaxID=1049789 RepID=T0GAQ6_9LEPT|nr:hypothetical protein [Leptospira broomii]EQA43924.1 hypothetical protein LEP1GSC050_4265 [Leptospira broomii serovar Hurstbridge str. 5399]
MRRLFYLGTLLLPISASPAPSLPIEWVARSWNQEGEISLLGRWESGTKTIGGALLQAPFSAGQKGELRLLGIWLNSRDLHTSPLESVGIGYRSPTYESFRVTFQVGGSREVLHTILGFSNRSGSLDFFLRKSSEERGYGGILRSAYSSNTHLSLSIELAQERGKASETRFTIGFAWNWDGLTGDILLREASGEVNGAGSFGITKEFFKNRELSEKPSLPIGTSERTRLPLSPLTVDELVKAGFSITDALQISKWSRSDERIFRDKINSFAPAEQKKIFRLLFQKKRKLDGRY